MLILGWLIVACLWLKKKARGEAVYPYNAHYKELFNNFYEAFMCLNISESIEKETKEYLHNDQNMELISQLKNIIIK